MAQQSAVAAYGPDGRPLSGTAAAAYGSGMAQQGSGQPQLTPEEQMSNQLAAKDRERADAARFASNLAYVQPNSLPPRRRSRLKGAFRQLLKIRIWRSCRRASQPRLPAHAQQGSSQMTRSRRPLTTGRRRSISITPWASLMSFTRG